MTKQNLEVQAKEDALQAMLEEGVIEVVVEEVVQTVKSDIKGAGKNSPSNIRLSDGRFHPNDSQGTALTDTYNMVRVSGDVAKIESGIDSKVDKITKGSRLKKKGSVMVMPTREYGEATVNPMTIINDLASAKDGDKQRLPEYLTKNGKSGQDSSVVKVSLGAYSLMNPEAQEVLQWLMAYGFVFYTNGGWITTKGKIHLHGISKNGTYVNSRLVDFIDLNGGYISPVVETVDGVKHYVKTDQYGFTFGLSEKGRDNHSGEYTIQNNYRINTPENKEPKKPSSVLLTCENNDGNAESATCNSEIRIKTSLAEELAKKERSFTCYCGGKFIS